MGGGVQPPTPGTKNCAEKTFKVLFCWIVEALFCGLWRRHLAGSHEVQKLCGARLCEKRGVGVLWPNSESPDLPLRCCFESTFFCVQVFPDPWLWLLVEEFERKCKVGGAFRDCLPFLCPRPGGGGEGRARKLPSLF